MFASSLFVTLALSASTLATVFVTAPVSSTVWNGGQQATISWQDSGSAPTLQSFGPSSVAIYAGNADQQTMLQSISTNVDVSTTASIVFTPNPTIGPSGNEYFIRFQSLSLKDTTNPQYPALAFSAKFTLNSMSGTFNASVQAEINGQSTAPIAQPTSSGTSPNAPPAAATTAASTAATHAAAASSSPSAGASSANSASGLGVAGFTAFAGVAFAILGNAFL